MSAPATLFRPFSRLVKISILGKQFDVPENNPLLRCFQYLATEAIAYVRFCWNEDCQYCRVKLDFGEGTPTRTAREICNYNSPSAEDKAFSRPVKVSAHSWRSSG